MTRQTYHCLCGFASDSPGTCEKCKTALYPKRWTPVPADGVIPHPTFTPMDLHLRDGKVIDDYYLDPFDVECGFKPTGSGWDVLHFHIPQLNPLFDRGR